MATNGHQGTFDRKTYRAGSDCQRSLGIFCCRAVTDPLASMAESMFQRQVAERSSRYVSRKSGAIHCPAGGHLEKNR